jgi:hypothetical protein
MVPAQETAARDNSLPRQHLKCTHDSAISPMHQHGHLSAPDEVQPQCCQQPHSLGAVPHSLVGPMTRVSLHVGALGGRVQVVVWVVLIQTNARCFTAIYSMATARAAAAAGGGGADPVIADVLWKGCTNGCWGCCCCQRWGQRPLTVAGAATGGSGSAGGAAGHGLC